MAILRSAPLVLLGPQRHAPTVRDALAPLVDDDGRHVAAVTAGWEEREAEDLELGEHLGRPVANLGLNDRADDVFQRDPALFQALRERRDRLTALHRLYRVRLRYLAPAAQDLLQREGPEDLIEPEREAAFDGLRALDAHHLRRIHDLQDEFRRTWHLSEHGAVARHREELADILQGAAALCIAGGHVGILHDRLWLFDLLGTLPASTPVIAWSAGAMALAERIVLFHDTPPQGRGWAEVHGPGLGLCPGVLPLPHARRRLRLDDPTRVQLLSRRFPTLRCVALDEGAQLTWDGVSWSASPDTNLLGVDGRLVAMEAQEEED